MIPWRRAVAISAGVMVAVALTGCGASATSASSGNPPSAATSVGAPPSAGSSSGSKPASAAIGIQGFSYASPPSVSPGAKVTVTNHDSVAHTVTSDTDGLFNVNVQPGANATFTAPTKPGSYKFHCIYHGNMHGTLVVK